MTAEPRSATRIVVSFIIFTLIWGSTWIVIRGQLGTVPPQWSVAYRFIIAAIAMALVARWKGEDLRLGWSALPAAAFLGIAQFGVNFNAVYLAERDITSGVVATVFALLLVPSSLLAWAFLGQRPAARFLWGSLVAIGGVALLFAHELANRATSPRALAVGIGWTVVGMIGAAASNVYQARPQIRHFPLFSLLAWAMAGGAVFDIALAFLMAGPPQFDPSPAYWLGLLYLALAASVLTFSLYYPVVRTIGPAKAAYASMLVPIIAMSFSTWLEDYHWTRTTIAGGILVIAGMTIALSRNRTKITAPDAA